jgi:hypothetical protein
MKMQNSLKKTDFDNYFKIDRYYKFKFREESWSSFSRPAERYLAPSTPMLLDLFEIIKEKLKTDLKKD